MLQRGDPSSLPQQGRVLSRAPRGLRPESAWILLSDAQNGGGTPFTPRAQQKGHLEASGPCPAIWNQPTRILQKRENFNLLANSRWLAGHTSSGPSAGSDQRLTSQLPSRMCCLPLTAPGPTSCTDRSAEAPTPVPQVRPHRTVVPHEPVSTG